MVLEEPSLKSEKQLLSGIEQNKGGVCGKSVSSEIVCNMGCVTKFKKHCLYQCGLILTLFAPSSSCARELITGASVDELTSSHFANNLHFDLPNDTHKISVYVDERKIHEVRFDYLQEVFIVRISSQQ